MAIKSLTFSFNVPMTSLLSLIAAGSADMRIDVMGDNKPPKTPKQLNGAHPAVKLLEGPKPHTTGQPRQRGKDANGKPLTAYEAILRAFAKAKDHTAETTDLRKLVTSLGLSPTSTNSQISLMRQRGQAKRIGEKTYALTAAGIAECHRREIPVTGDKLKKAKAKPKTKSKTQPEAATVTEEGHGEG